MISVVGGKETFETGRIHEVQLVDNNGQVEKIWKFVIDCIMEPPDTVDLKPVSSLFPNISDNFLGRELLC